MPPSHPDQPLSFASGRYRVRRLLGEGGMGVVYQAHDDNLDCEVVIKTPRRALLDEPGFADRFAREIRSLVALAHPHIVKIIDVGKQDGLPFAVMQYLEGGSLADRPLPATSASLKAWLLSVAQALDFVHQQGFLHRDVKPANILFDAHGNAYLGDFGVARVLSTVQPTPGQARLTSLGLVLGTPEYLAPELVMGKPEPDGRADQYALAATVYHMLAGQPPFDGPTPTAIMVRQTTEPVPPLREIAPGVSAGLAAAIEKALSKKPEERHANCVALVKAAFMGNTATDRLTSPKATPSRPVIAPTRIEEAPRATPARPVIAPTRIEATPAIAPPPPRKAVAPTRIGGMPEVPTPESLIRSAKGNKDGWDPIQPKPSPRVRNPAASGPANDEPEQVEGIGKWVVLTIFASLVLLGGGAGAIMMLRPNLFRRSHHVVEMDKIGKDRIKGIDKEKSKMDKIGKDKIKGIDEEKPKLAGKFKASKAMLALERPVVGETGVLRVDLDFPKDAPHFPVDRLKFSIADREVPTKRQGDGTFLVIFPRPGPQKLRAEFAGDERFEKVVMEVETRVLLPLPKFTIEATPRSAKRGDKIELSIKGLPKEFTAFDKIGLFVLGDGSKITPSPNGKKPIVLEGLKPGKHSIMAKFSGDDTFAAGESSNAAQIRVQRKPVFEFKPLNRDAVSRGKLDLDVTVRGSEIGEPTPKGSLQLMSKDQLLAEGKLDDNGRVALKKDSLDTGSYELKLLFSPDEQDKDEWPTVEEPLPGSWQVIQTAVVKVDLGEKDLGPRRLFAVRFKTAEHTVGLPELPPGKRYFLEFRPAERVVTGNLKITGKYVPKFEVMDGSGNARLALRWETAKESWDKEKLKGNIPLFPIITMIVTEPVEKKVGDRPEEKKSGSFEYTLNNAFPPPRPVLNQRPDPEAYVPLVTSFRNVMQSLHGAEIEVYEGIDKKEKVKDAAGKDTDKTVRVKKDPSALPLLRLKLLK